MIGSGHLDAKAWRIQKSSRLYEKDWSCSVAEASKLEKTIVSENASRLRQELDEYYLPTIQFIDQILGRRVDAWRVRATVDVVAESH